MAENPSPGRRDWIPRIALALVLFCLAVEGTREGIATRLGDSESLSRIRSAEEWDPPNPDLPVAAAAALAASTDSDPSQAVASLERAVRIAPNRAMNWALLGNAYEAAGDRAAADSAFARGLRLFPRSPEINWMYGNFLIRSGDADRAIAPLELAIEGDSTLWTGAFDLAWRAGIPSNLILDAVPHEPATLAAYLDFLVGTNRLDAAATVWPLLLAQPGRFELDTAFRYFDGLLYAHHVDDMARVWSDIARRDPERVPPDAGDSNLIRNGGFETAPLNGGFGWRLVPVGGADISTDSMEAHEGSRSLCIHFDGKHNLEFTHVVQYVRVVPSTPYTFSAYARGSNITTDSGPRFAIYDAFDHRQISVETSGMTGTFTWHEERTEFTTGPVTRVLVIQIHRPPSTKFDNQIAGTLWVDDVSLVRTR
ncbi:MAG TPA: carbohydrate binding domain-containing protein [Candidatus Limnocylindrales bacterium]|nr:carbohydrate binding domain-containing protein [Candidatus Limnocylindrales bacterium]